MNWAIVKAIAKKDLIEVSQNKSVWVSMLVVPVIFLLVIPLATILVPNLMEDPSMMVNDPDIAMMFEQMPAVLAANLQGLDEYQTMLMMILGYLFAPMFLIFPIMYSTIIAAESFAGERERKTMEALLYTPASDLELFFGKLMAGFAPAVAFTWVSFILYTVILNVAAWPSFQRIWFPLPGWYPLIFWVTPALAFMGVCFTVLISSKTQTFMGAYQLSASLVIIVVALMAGQAAGVVYFSVGIGLLVGLVFWVISAVLFVIAIRSFNRSKLLVSSSG
jgi:ABC-type Na+ efflux pump permease subunit